MSARPANAVREAEATTPRIARSAAGSVGTVRLGAESLLTDAEGAGEHCHMGALTRAHQRMFDWLDDTLAAD